MTPIVALEPFVERVVGAGRLMDGRMDTHMILRGLPRDSKKLLRGLRPP
jgi:hypothetical protein